MNQSSVIDRYASGGALLKYAVSGLTDEQALAKPGTGAWSIAELVAHLLDSELVHIDRMKRVIAEENPILVAFDENAWIDRLDSQSMPVDEAVDLFDRNCRWMARVLRQCTESDFARTGQHTERGPLTLAALLATSVNHTDHHLRFLYAKRANLGVAVAPHYSHE